MSGRFRGRLGGVRAGFRPDRYDIIGAAICLLGVAVIMYAPRSTALATVVIGTGVIVLVANALFFLRSLARLVTMGRVR